MTSIEEIEYSKEKLDKLVPGLNDSELMGIHYGYGEIQFVWKEGDVTHRRTFYRREFGKRFLNRKIHYWRDQHDGLLISFNVGKPWWKFW